MLSFVLSSGSPVRPPHGAVPGCRSGEGRGRVREGVVPVGDVPDHPPPPDPTPGAMPSTSAMPATSAMPVVGAVLGSVPAPRLPAEPEWLTQLPVSAGVRSVPAGTGAEVLPRAGSVPAAPRRGRGLTVAAGVLAVVVAVGAAVAVTGTGQRILGRVGPSTGALSGGPGTVPGPGAEASGAVPSGVLPMSSEPTAAQFLKKFVSWKTKPSGGAAQKL